MTSTDLLFATNSSRAPETFHTLRNLFIREICARRVIRDSDNTGVGTSGLSEGFDTQARLFSKRAREQRPYEEDIPRLQRG